MYQSSRLELQYLDISSNAKQPKNSEGMETRENTTQFTYFIFIKRKRLTPIDFVRFWIRLSLLSGVAD